MTAMRYLVTNPHNPPVVVRGLDNVRDLIRDDYYTAFDGSGDLPGVAEATDRLTWRGGTIPLPDNGAIVVRPTLFGGLG